jgi:hypothetical protein
MLIGRATVTLRAPLLALCATLLTAGAWSQVAQAGSIHKNTGLSFGPEGTAAGSFSKVGGVTVEQASGDVLVYDSGEGGRIYKFDASGEPVDFAATGTNVITEVGEAGPAETELALDNSAGPAAGDIYAANNHTVRIYSQTGAPLGELSGGEMCGVATDTSGAVYVGMYPKTVSKYVPLMNPVTNGELTSSMEGLRDVCNVAADSEGNVYAAAYSGGVTRYEAAQFGSPSATGTEIDTSGRTLAIDPSTDDLYVNAENQIEQFGPSGSPIGVSGDAGMSESAGVGVKAGGERLYVPNAARIEAFGENVTVPDATTTAPELHPTTAVLKGTVNPDGLPVSSCEFEYGPQAQEGYPDRAPCSALPGSGSEPVQVSAAVNGLEPDTAYRFRLAAGNANGSSQSAQAQFQTLGPGLISASLQSGGTRGATFLANVEPNTEPTTVLLEYGTSDAYGSSTAPVSVGDGSAGVQVTLQLERLAPETAYHARVVVHNASGTVTSADIILRTYALVGLGLPDGREYELVTPVENAPYVYSPFGGNAPGAGISGLTTKLPVQASPDGSAVMYVADPTAGSPGSGYIGPGTGNEYLARRSTAGEWITANVQPAGVLHGFYAAFSANLTEGVLDSNVPLVTGAPPGAYTDLYSRNLPDGEYQAFFTGAPPNRTVGQFGAAGVGGEKKALWEFYAGASADFSRQFFAANAALSAGAVDGGAGENNLYESTTGGLRLLNVLPDGSTEPNATFGSGPINYDNPPGVTHAISADGARVFWTDLNTGDLYVREDGATTTQIDASQGPGTSGGGLFWTASSDGSKVFFTDCSQLTPDSTAVSTAGCGTVDSSTGLTGDDLYEYEVPSGRLRDLTVDANLSDSSGADVQGVAGASEDGEYVYFVADGVLAAGATAQEPNLYFRHQGVTTFVSTLEGEELIGDGGIYGGGYFNDIQPNQGHRTAIVTPDGHSLTFMSDRSLTGYPNEGFYEVYVYDADTATLTCASCDPAGAAPPLTGVLDNYFPHRVASFLPVSWSGVRQPRVISADGSRVFFDSIEPLVPQDTNGMLDAYEWERDGAGSCRSGGGCVYLLSAGTSLRYSYVLEASTSGDDVFVSTSAQLLPQDTGEGFDVYDARVGAMRSAPSSCTGTGCQGVPGAPPIFATPASVTFAGVGNFAAPAKAAVKAKPKKKKPKKKPKKRKPKKKARKRGERTGKGKRPGEAHKSEDRGNRR